MKNFPSLKKNSDFQRVYSKRKSLANRYLIMYVAKNEIGETRIGISVSKKVGNSVVRHHITRLIRESYRLNLDHIEKGYDYVIVARPLAKDQGFFEIEKSFIHVLGLHGLYIE